MKTHKTPVHKFTHAFFILARLQIASMRPEGISNIRMLRDTLKNELTHQYPTADGINARFVSYERAQIARLYGPSDEDDEIRLSAFYDMYVLLCMLS